MRKMTKALALIVCVVAVAMPVARAAGEAADIAIHVSVLGPMGIGEGVISLSNEVHLEGLRRLDVATGGEAVLIEGLRALLGASLVTDLDISTGEILTTDDGTPYDFGPGAHILSYTAADGSQAQVQVTVREGVAAPTEASETPMEPELPPAPIAQEVFIDENVLSLPDETEPVSFGGMSTGEAGEGF